MPVPNSSSGRHEEPLIQDLTFILLKSPSPNPASDPYTTSLAPLSQASHQTTPCYVPVLTHTLKPDQLIKLLLRHLDPASPYFSTTSAGASQFPFGALVLTSQRSVAALSTALSSPPIQSRISADRLNTLFAAELYAVGPATARALEEVRAKWLQGCPEVKGGKDAGSGDILAQLILRDYKLRNEDGATYGQRKPVLFLAGETRRDVIPRMLQSEDLPQEERIKVHEMEVYASAELESFEFDLQRSLRETKQESNDGVRWLVVFSPAAGKAVLRSLGWLDEKTGKVQSNFNNGKGDDGGGVSRRRDFVCCIGPTTKAYMQREFAYEADVVAEKPSPEGVRESVSRFMRTLQAQKSSAV